MPSSYTSSLRLTLPSTGELSGQWGNTVNTGITELLDAAVAGTTTISSWGGAGVSYTLSNNSGTADEARKMFIVATGSPGEAKNVICPAVSKFYVFRNDTAGGYALTLKTPTGTGISVPAGQYRFLYCDGTNVVETFNSVAALVLSGTLTVGGNSSFNTVTSGTWQGTAVGISYGGTGATTKTSAFNALTPMTTLGDVEYHDGTNAVRLAGNTTSTRKFFRQTGNGTVSAAPTWDTLTDSDIPNALTGKTYNALSLTANATGFSVAGGTTAKTLTVNNNLTLSGTDGSTLNIGGGGTLGSAAFTASTAYPSTTGSGASGTWSISVTGNAATVTSITSGQVTTALGFTPYNSTNPSGYITSSYTGFMLRGSTVQTNPNTNFSSSAWRFDPNANNPTNDYYAIVTYGNESNVVGQLATHFQSGQTFTRAYNTAWSGWRTLLDSSNYNSYSPTLTGGGASGTWGISITGRGYPRRSDGGDLNFYWSGQSGQPTWLWGGTDGVNMYVYNPSNFSVNYAASSGTSSSCSGNAATASYATNAGGINATAALLGYSYSATNTAAGSQAGPQIQGQGSGGAVFSLHRPGAYGLNIGLDSDNVFRIGGWSASANRLQMDMSGNLTMAGNVTAYSDERLKKDWAELPSNFVDQLAQVKSGTYTRIDSGERQAGASAQDWKRLLPEVVTEDNQGTLSLAYGNAALAAAVALAKRVVELEARLAALEA